MAEKGTRVRNRQKACSQKSKERVGLSLPSRSKQALAPLYKPTRPRFFTIHMAERRGAPSTVLAISP